MIRLTLLGIWMVFVTAGAALLSAKFLNGPHLDSEESLAQESVVEELKTEMTSIPMVRGGEILGYVIIQLSFAADKVLLEQFRLEPAAFMTDAAFRTIYANSEVDFRRLRKGDLDLLTSAIAREANQRMGSEIVKQVLIQQLNFVKKEEIRTNWIGSKAAGE